MKYIVLLLILTISYVSSASKITKLAIVTTTDCAARSIPNASCLPSTTQIWDSTNSQTLDVTIASIGAGIAFRTVSSASTMTNTDGIVELNSSTPFNFTLQAANSVVIRKIWILTNTGTANVTILPTGSDTIQGEALQVLTPGSSIPLSTNSSNAWYIF